MPALLIRLFGHLEIQYMDKPLPVPATRKAQVLLGYLLLHREQPHFREHLAELFWGDRPNENARRSLANAVWQINHCLPNKSYLLNYPNTIQFNPQSSLAIDIEDFERLVSQAGLQGLRSAISLYRGDFLAGSYEDWIIHERYRLENLYLDGLALLMTTYEAQSQYAPALETALNLLKHDPLREDAHRAAMRIYCRLGKRNTALKQYRRCQQVIQKELNAEPMLETNQLYSAILEGQIAPDARFMAESLQPEEVSLQRPIGSNPLDLSELPPFLGREPEIRALDTAWQQATQNQGAFMLIWGEAGIGKTRLVDEFSQRLRWKGVPVLWGRCYEFERILPYQPIVEALRSISTELACFQTDDEKPWFVQEVFRLVPELASLYPELARRSSSQVEADQARLFEGVRCFLTEISRPNGLLLVIEDLHWAAESTLEILHYLVRHLVDSPIMILCTLRSEEAKLDHPIQAFQEQLNREGLLRDLQLKRLSPADMKAIVSKMSGQGEAILPLAQQLYQETEGNPFFLMEIIKALFDNHKISIDQDIWVGDFDQISASRFPLPARVNDVVRYRINQLDKATQEAVSIAAVIGREFDFELLKDAWEGNPEKTLQALDTLLRRRLVEEGSGSLSRDYSFTHHKIQEVIYEDISLRRRNQIHDRIGSILEGATSEKSPDLAGELAFHFSHSKQLSKENYQKAIHYLLLAGDQARLMYAQREATGYYHQALELLKGEGDYQRRARVNVKLGVTYLNAFDYEQAHQAFEEGFRLWQKVSRSDQPASIPAPHPLRTNWPPITSLDPAFAMGLAGALAWQLFCGLVTFSPDMEVIPDAADKWQLYSGGREYVFHIRDDIRWSDGKPLTAHDFEYSAKRMLAPESKSPVANLLYDIKGARSYHLGELYDPDQIGLRAVDAATLTIELEKPTAYFLQLLANFLAVPYHCIESFYENWTEAECIVTSGPFKMVGWEKRDSILLMKNPTYHGLHMGNIQQVWLNLRPDFHANVKQYEQGELDVLDLRFYPVAVYEKAVRQFVDEYLSLPSASLSFIGFNVAKHPFQDVRVRRAFALAVDKEVLAGVVQRGAVFPATGGCTPPGLPGHQPGIGLPYDPKGAKDLLAQAGFPAGRGFPEVEALTPLTQDNPLNEFLSAQWEEILGVKIAWQTMAPGFQIILESKPPNIFISHWHADYPDPDDFLGASQLLRWTGWQDETYLSILEEARSITNQSKRMAFFNQADRLLMESAAIVPITYNRQHFLIKPWVKRYPTSALYSWFWKDVVIEPH